MANTIKNSVDGTPLEDSLSVVLNQYVENDKTYLSGNLNAGRAQYGFFDDDEWNLAPDADNLKSSFEISLEPVDDTSDVISIHDLLVSSFYHGNALDGSSNYVKFLVELNEASSYVLHLSQKVFRHLDGDIYKYVDTFSKSLPIIPEPSETLVPAKRVLDAELVFNYNDSCVFIGFDTSNDNRNSLTEVILTIQNMTTFECHEFIVNADDLYNNQSPDHIVKDGTKIKIKLPVKKTQDFNEEIPVLGHDIVYKFGMYAENTNGRSALSNRVRIKTLLITTTPEFLNLIVSPSGNYFETICKTDISSKIEFRLFDSTSIVEAANDRVPIQTFKMPCTYVDILNNQDQGPFNPNNFSLDGQGNTVIKWTEETIQAVSGNISNVEFKELLSQINGKFLTIDILTEFKLTESDAVEDAIIVYTNAPQKPFVHDSWVSLYTYSDVILDVGEDNYTLTWGANITGKTFNPTGPLAKYSVTTTLNMIGKQPIIIVEEWDSSTSEGIFSQSLVFRRDFFNYKTEKQNFSLTFTAVPIVDENGFDNISSSLSYVNQVKNNLSNEKISIVNLHTLTSISPLYINIVNVKPEPVVFTGLRISSDRVFVQFDKTSTTLTNTKEFQGGLYRYNSSNQTYTPATYEDNGDQLHFPTLTIPTTELNRPVEINVVINGVNYVDKFEENVEYAVGAVAKSSNINTPDSIIAVSDRFTKNDFTTNINELSPTLEVNRSYTNSNLTVTGKVILAKNQTATKKVSSIILYALDQNGEKLDGLFQVVDVDGVEPSIENGKEYYLCVRELPLVAGTGTDEIYNNIIFRITAELITTDGLGVLEIDSNPLQTNIDTFNTFDMPVFENITFTNSVSGADGYNSIEFDVRLNGHSLDELIKFVNLGIDCEVFVMSLPTTENIDDGVERTEFINGVKLSQPQADISHGSAIFTSKIDANNYMLILGVNERRFVVSRSGVYGPSITVVQ